MDDKEIILERLSKLEEKVDAQNAQIEAMKKVLLREESLGKEKPLVKEVILERKSSSEKKEPSDTKELKFDKEALPDEEAATRPEYTYLFDPPSDNLSKKDKTPSLEMKIGGTFINRVGIVAIIIGLAYFLKYTFDNDIIGPMGRISIGILIGLSLISMGEYFSKKYHSFGVSLIGGGNASLYFSIFAAFNFYHFINQPTAFALLVLVTLSSSTMSLRHNSPVIMFFSTIFGYMTPFMVSSNTPNDYVFLGYIILLSLGILGVSIFKKWKFLNYLSFVIVEILFTLWLFERGVIYDAYYYARTIQFSLGQSSAAIIFLIFLAVSIFYSRNGNKLDFVLPVLNSGLFFWQSYYLIDMKAPSFLGLYAVSMSAFFLLVAYFLLKKANIPGTMFAVLLGISLTFITVAIPIQLKGNYIVLSWAVESSVFMYLSFKLNYSGLRLGSYIIMLVTFLRIGFVEYDAITYLYRPFSGLGRENPPVFTPIFNLPTIILFFSLCCLFLNVWFLVKNKKLLTNPKEYKLTTLISIITNVSVINLLFVNVSIYFDILMESSRLQLIYDLSIKSMEEFTNSAVLILYSLGCVIVGMRLKSRSMRIFALALFMASILKVFLVDLSVLTGGYRIMSFVSLGIILVGVSYLYQKYSHIINYQEANNEKL